jgi:uncharacterized membrane protein YfcA
MRAPMRVAVATSNYIIGHTGAAGAYAYLFRGDIDPRQAAPVVVGVVIGAAAGARLSAGVRTSWLVIMFATVLAYVAVEMAQRALGLA